MVKMSYKKNIKQPLSNFKQRILGFTKELSVVGATP